MASTIISELAIDLVPAIIAASVVYLVNRHQINKYKADSMAERSAKLYLKHKGYTDRKFETIKNHLGGWDNDEDGLRRILVRAGAVRVFRSEGMKKIEFWYLLGRLDERIKKFETKKEARK